MQSVRLWTHGYLVLPGQAFHLRQQAQYALVWNMLPAELKEVVENARYSLLSFTLGKYPNMSLITRSLENNSEMNDP